MTYKPTNIIACMYSITFPGSDTPMPKEMKPNGIKDELFICLNLFIEIKPINIGNITACK